MFGMLHQLHQNEPTSDGDSGYSTSGGVVMFDEARIIFIDLHGHGLRGNVQKAATVEFGCSGLFVDMMEE
jgi:hypothetical protein